MAPHSSTLTWKIPWAEKPGGLQFIALQRIRHNWAISTFTSFVLSWVCEGWIACVGLRLVEVDYFPQWQRSMLKIQIVRREWRKTVTNMSIVFSAKLCEQSILPWQQELSLQNMLCWTRSFQLGIDSLREWNKENNLSQGRGGGWLLKVQLQNTFGVNLGASLMVQFVKNLPAMLETAVQFLGQEDLLVKV